MSDSAAERPTNRLIHETSPYLQQHAHNPVDWYPWGGEAFQRARAEDKAIFLSVGYSACHWCHVMEHESFENDRIAAVMNEHFVNIKVDREERPDVDQIYMSAVQLMTQRGGWPMSVFLTPDGRPFYGGTYWPPESRMGMPGFRDILLKLSEFWSQRRDEVNTSADSLVDAIARLAASDVAQQSLNDDVLRGAMNSLLSAADRTQGGFGGAPKFPHPMDVRVLLRGWKRFGNQDSLDIARLTLEKMALGGIYDHLGGGFHRYSTDAQWLVPHFEKMLYDNALLVPAYLEFIQCAPQESVPHIGAVRETLNYVLREMTHESGAFFSTQDADSEGEEGKFFVWTEDEILEHLDPADARLFTYCYDVTPRGNWEGQTILNRPKPHEQAARVLGVEPEELQTVLDRCKTKLFEVRAERVAPGRDDKFITAWNGMMITAFAQAAQVLDEPTYADAARRAADAIWEHLRDERGRLLHSSKDDRPGVGAFLDDYACLIDGLVDLYQARFEPDCLERAVTLAEQLIEHFADEERGGFFYTANDHEELIARSKDTQDSATPSGNGMAATALLKLGRITGRSDLESHARRTLESLSGLIAEHPRAAGQALIALDSALGPAHEIVLVDGADPTETESALRQLHGKFLPGKLVVRRMAGLADGGLPEVLRPLLRERSAGDELTVYVCAAGTCSLPATGLAEVTAAIEQFAAP